MNINQAAKVMSKRGASKGGVARSASLSSERRKQIASIAAAERWRIHGKEYDQAIADSCDGHNCPCREFRKRRKFVGQCSLSQPLWMVIPPQGVHLPCPVHGKHFIPGGGLVWSA